MTLSAQTVWKLACDKHGLDAFAGEEASWRACDTEQEAREAVEDAEGRVEPDGTVLCGRCIEDEEIAAANEEADRA